MPGYIAGHRSLVSSVRLTEPDLEEITCLQVVPFNEATQILSLSAVIGNINSVV